MHFNHLLTLSIISDRKSLSTIFYKKMSIIFDNLNISILLLHWI
nr:MAG TPA: hypothetical protein [Caudoviricetes sp.]